MRNGPLHVEGGVEISGRDDGSTYRSEDAWLCRCGSSSDKPFCDGSHARVEFTTAPDE